GTASNASSENYGIRVSSSGSGATNYGVYASASGGSTNYAGFFEGNVHVTGNITANNITSPSDSRLKTNIGNIENPLHKIMSLNGVSYKWNAEEFPERYFDNRTHIGIIAQNIEEVQGLEDLVYTDENGYKSVSYDELIPILIEAVKALKSENEGLKSRIEALESLP
ncbi:MAG TPA: tail fiber domain-containing protein, partial [Bacteroidetes bacterium]|nr:tail fiber domain-containing protein [Bacteroidota bacterium]